MKRFLAYYSTKLTRVENFYKLIPVIILKLGSSTQNKMDQILTDHDYKIVIQKIQQLSEIKNAHSIFTPEINQLRELAINYEYKRYDLTLVKDFDQQLSATG
ncbi:hypothetical protein EA772_14965 [Pedobacter sp. G11]|uniref:hypothetical protein n=1 Tax=Pedobacter sp. G11 TaxID=2482728 RepID=UPI000F5D8680|nr:hypothetical protein [Pedobacter sp. G11]AZI26580.1 hypothetical protein EA772_14965 [Pedobacter sp. G11]